MKVECAMYKLKSKSGAAKRFRATANGYKFHRVKRRHNLTTKTTKHKRQIRAMGSIDKSDIHAIDRMLPYAK
jgi:large subunit ribosomal protein L35